MASANSRGDSKVREIFLEALEKATPQEQEAYLDGACRGDAGLRARIEGLLKSHRQDDFLALPAVAVDRTSDTAAGVLSEKPGDHIGRYKLLEKIGEGGCGVVYVAEQQEPVRRRVALKVIKLGMDTRSVVARFEAERQALALMDHPNIAKVLDGGATESGRPYFVMELVRGLKITEYCDQNGLPTAQRLELFIHICRAVQHAHQKGIIHRDLKPSNIMVTVNDGVPVPKVIDFGIAKATQGELSDKTVYTQFQQFIGTPAYMSPEQAELSSVDIDTRADIYALGVLLYELLTGRTPFEAKELLKEGLDELRRTIREREAVRPSTRLSALAAEDLTTTAQHRRTEPVKLIHFVRGDLDWIVMKCLEKDRARRYETANGLAADLKRHLNNEPVVARPPSTAYRLQKAWRRNKLAFTAAAAVAAALVVGITFSTWQAIEASRARNGEMEQRLAAQKDRDKAQTAQKEAERSQQAEKRERLRADAEKAESSHLLYVADMNLAQQAWDQNNIGLLRQLLEDTQESPYRGFEWYYWQPLTHLALKTLRGHLKVVTSVAFSPDGTRIVTASEDQTAKVWETTSGNELFTFKRHTGEVYSAAFSPDGRRIVTGSSDNTAKVWDATSGRQLLTLWGHSNWVNAVAYSSDGQRVVTGSEDQTAKVWDATSGKELLTLTGHTAQIWGAAFSPDGQRIVTGSWDQTARVWDAATGHELLKLNWTNRVFAVAFSPNGRRIVTGGQDGAATVWDAASGSELLPLEGHTGVIQAVAFSPDGQWVLTGSWDQTARVWDADSGHEVLRLKGHGAQVWGVAFSSDGRRIATGSWDGTAKVWDAATDRTPDQTRRNLLTLKGHAGWILSAALSPDGQRIVTGSRDQTAKVWDAATGHELLTLNGHKGWIWSVAFSPDGHRIVTSSEDRMAKVWDATSGKDLFTLTGHEAGIAAVAFSPDGQRIVTGSDDGTARVWEAATGHELLTLEGRASLIQTVAFSPDGRRIVTGRWDGTAKVWDAVSGRELLTLNGHTAPLYSVAFSPDGQQIVTGCFDGTATVWEAASGMELFPLKGHSDRIASVAFSPDGQRIVTGSADKTAKVWETASGRELLTLKGHGAPIWLATFSPDGQRIVTASRDGTVRIWATARAAQVAAWQEEEKTAAQALASMQAQQERQRVARSSDSIQRWLVLAPIALATGQSGAAGLDIEQIEGEGLLRPKVGEASSIAGGDLKWREVALTNEVIDFNALLGQETTQSVAYAVCYLRSESEQRGLQILVGSDDEAKVYLNGKQIYKSLVPRPFVAEEDTVPDIALNAGLNVLVLKVVNEQFDWKGSIRFVDAHGNPVKGIQVTLDPKGRK